MGIGRRTLTKPLKGVICVEIAQQIIKGPVLEHQHDDMSWRCSHVCVNVCCAAPEGGVTKVRRGVRGE